jgi:hypothetical protein
MHLYRFDFLDAAGVVTHCHSVRLSTDTAAMQVGHRMLVDHSQDCALKIWHRNHLVHHETRLAATVVG